MQALKYRGRGKKLICRRYADGASDSDLPDGDLLREGRCSQGSLHCSLASRHLKLFKNRLRFRADDSTIDYHINLQDLVNANRRKYSKNEKDFSPGYQRRADHTDAIILTLKNGTHHEFRLDSTENAKAWLAALKGESSAKGDGSRFATTEEEVDVAVDGAAGAVGMTEDEKEKAAEEEQEFAENEDTAADEGGEAKGKDNEETVGRVRANTKNVEQCAGWLYKLGEQKLGVAGAYRKRWFSLRKERCRTLNTRAEVFNGASQVASILRGARYDDRLPGCPDNSIDIVTPGRICSACRRL